MRRRAALLATLLALAACRTAPPPVADAVTVGDWTVSTGGRVRVEAGYVN